MSALAEIWTIITDINRVDDLPLVRLPLTTSMEDTSGRGADESLTCNAVASVTDYQGIVTATKANEIRIKGARRVDHTDGLDYGAGALGIEYFDTDTGGTALSFDPLGDEYIEEVENLLLQSEDLSTTWDTSSVTLTTNDTTAPDGTTTADHIAYVSSNSDRSNQTITIAASVTHNVSIYLKNDDAQQSKINVYDNNAVAILADLQFLWSAGVPATSSSTGASNITYTLINSLWYRISFDFTTAATVTTHEVQVIPEAALAVARGIWAWGSQLNTGSLKQYVPTTTAAATAYPLAGQLIEESSTNLFVSPTAAATQNITTTAQDYTVSITGTGDITLTGTATGTATEGNPLTVTATAGTLTCTVNGTVDIGQVEAKSYPTSFMLDATTRPVTDARVVFPSAMDNDFKVAFDFSGMLNSNITGVTRWLFFIGTDVNNYVGCQINAGSTTLSLIKRISGVSYTSSSAASVDLSVQHSIICTISSTTGVTLAIDGVAETADANTDDIPIVVKTVFIGQYYDQTDLMNGSVKNLVVYQDTSAAPYTTRLTLTDIGLTLDGSKMEVTGVGGSTLYEDLQFTAIWFDNDNVDIDWSEHGLTAPADTWTVGGMVRLYQAAGSCDGAMRVSFNPHEISAITSTGDTGEDGEANVLNSNRGITHTLSGGTDHEIVPTFSEGNGRLIDSVSLVDFSAVKADGSADKDTQIRIRGGGAVSAVDVVYPAVPARYTLNGRPAIGYPGINTDGHNDNDHLRHFVSYIPPIVSDGTEKINIIDSNSGTSLEFSELLYCSYWTPVEGKNFDYGSQTVGSIVSVDTRRGNVVHRQRDGLDLSRSVMISMMSESDCTYIDLLMKSGRTIVFDSHPDEVELRYRTMVVGYLTSDISTQELSIGNTVELQVTDTKLQGDI